MTLTTPSPHLKPAIELHNYHSGKPILTQDSIAEKAERACTFGKKDKYI